MLFKPELPMNVDEKKDGYYLNDWEIVAYKGGFGGGYIWKKIDRKIEISEYDKYRISEYEEYKKQKKIEDEKSKEELDEWLSSIKIFDDEFPKSFSGKIFYFIKASFRLFYYTIYFTFYLSLGLFILLIALGALLAIPIKIIKMMFGLEF